MLPGCGAAVIHADGGRLTGEQMFESMYCIGYVAGFLDAMPVMGLTEDVRGTACLPKKGVSNEQALRIFVKHLRENPEHLHESARVQFYASIRNAFPCRQ